VSLHDSTSDASAQDPNYDFLPLYATQPGTGGVPGPLAGGEMCTFRCVSGRSQPDHNLLLPLWSCACGKQVLLKRRIRRKLDWETPLGADDPRGKRMGGTANTESSYREYNARHDNDRAMLSFFHHPSTLHVQRLPIKSGRLSVGLTVRPFAGTIAIHDSPSWFTPSAPPRFGSFRRDGRMRSVGRSPIC
jgi:hypothetical protein